VSHQCQAHDLYHIYLEFLHELQEGLFDVETIGKGSEKGKFGERVI
jgi:hypothetical protein